MSATTVPTDRPVTANWQKCKNPLDESVAMACNNFVASLPTTINFEDKTAAKAWIKKEWHNNRGHDIVTNKHVDLANLWRSVTQNWPALGEDFAKSIIAILSDGHENLSNDFLLESKKITDKIKQIIQTQRSLSQANDKVFIATLLKFESEAGSILVEGLAEDSVSQRLEAAEKKDIFKKSPMYQPRPAAEVDNMCTSLVVYHEFASKRVIDDIIEFVKSWVDPYNWDADTVIQWIRKLADPSMPEELEQKLLEHEVNRASLLLAVTDDVMRDDFKFNDEEFNIVSSAIGILRLQSTKYKQYLQVGALDASALELQPASGLGLTSC